MLYRIMDCARHLEGIASLQKERKFASQYEKTRLRKAAWIDRLNAHVAFEPFL